MASLHDAITPSKAAEILRNRGINISERTLRARARQIGAFREIGRAMFFMPEDIEAILESAKPTKSNRTAAHPSSWTDEDTAKLREKLVRGEKK